MKKFFVVSMLNRINDSTNTIHAYKSVKTIFESLPSVNDLTNLFEKLNASLEEKLVKLTNELNEVGLKNHSVDSVIGKTNLVMELDTAISSLNKSIIYNKMMINIMLNTLDNSHIRQVSQGIPFDKILEKHGEPIIEQLFLSVDEIELSPNIGIRPLPETKKEYDHNNGR